MQRRIFEVRGYLRVESVRTLQLKRAPYITIDFVVEVLIYPKIGSLLAGRTFGSTALL